MSGVDMLILTGAALVGAIAYFRSGGKSPVAALTSAPSDSPTLADVLASIDYTADRLASESVSQKITSHRAAKREAELLDALAPKATAQPPSQ